MASLHFPNYFHEELDEIMHLKSYDKEIKFPLKNQFVLASITIHQMYLDTLDIYNQSHTVINNYNDELKKLYRQLLKLNLFEPNGRGIPKDWKPKVG